MPQQAVRRPWRQCRSASCRRERVLHNATMLHHDVCPHICPLCALPHSYLMLQHLELASSHVTCISSQANPEAMKQAMDMMGQIDPEQMATMMASMQSGSTSAQSSASAMAGLLSNPKSRDLMRSMMSSIDPQQLTAMSKAAGHALTPEQVHPQSMHTPALSHPIHLLCTASPYVHTLAADSSLLACFQCFNKSLVRCRRNQ